MKATLALFGLLLVKGYSSLEVRFEDPTSAFFLKERQNGISSTASIVDSNTLDVVSPTTSIILGATGLNAEMKERSSKDLFQKSASSASSAGGSGDILHQESFTVVQSSAPVTVRAEYGPFETSQMVPTQYLVPDLMLENQEEKKPALITDFEPHQLDLSAHLVTNEVPKDNPVLRVLFHTANYHNIGHNARICIVLTASIEDDKRRKQQSRSVSQICGLRREEKDGTCLGQLTFPSSWWPSMMRQNRQKYDTSKAEMKQPKTLVDVKYSVFESRSGKSCQELGPTDKDPASSWKIPVTPETPIGVVTLIHPGQSYHQLAKDEMMHMLMPQGSFYPNSKFYVPVFLEEQSLTDLTPITAFTIKCRTRSGLRLLGVEEVSKAWKVRVDINARGTIATVTAFKKTLQTTADRSEDDKRDLSETPAASTSYGPQELFNWLLEIEDRDYDQWDQPKISWHVKYQRPLPEQPQNDQEFFDNEGDFEGVDHKLQKNSYRLRAKMSVKKDEVQAVIPIAKHKDLMNLAVLTGLQVSRPLKVFIVSQGGDVADVTLHSSCTSVDQSVLKVTASCTSVYVDGSESRGALAAEIDIKYGSSIYTGKAIFTVWMPETPLNIDVADSKLSQIKGWKVPSRQSRTTTPTGKLQNQTSFNQQCNPRYQQSSVRVFAKFLAQDPDSGRTEYFPSRSAESDVTDLVMGHGLRISNAAVATLRGNIIQGISPGRTEIKVVSPITGQEIGMREVRVAKNRETIRGMNVRILTGLGVNVQADPVQRGRYVLRTSYSQLLSSRYQEGLLDITLQMSDDTTLALRDVDPEDYYLAIKSLDSNVIALAPSRDARFPRVIAVGNGQGQLLRTSLELIDNCMQPKSSNLALAVQLADVNVQLKNSKVDLDYNMGNILSNIALRDEVYEESKSQQSLSSGKNQPMTFNFMENGHLTPLEVGMYILVAVLCAALAVFMASCFVYASKFRRQKYPVQTSLSKETSVQNAAHDWIWLGKSTSEVNVITNPRDELHQAERIPLQHLHKAEVNTSSRNSTSSAPNLYPRQQFSYDHHLPATYENIRRSRRMQLPPLPNEPRRRRLLPAINTATYTKKVADLNRASVLPVGYPLFTDLSPVKILPDPDVVDAPLRQSPASALPPILDQINSSNTKEDSDFKLNEYLNPDIYRPSPPRAGAARLFENPFDLTDEDSAPVEVPKKLSPSHVFESTSLEESLLSEQPPKSQFDTRTFVIRKSSAAAQESSSCNTSLNVESIEEDPIIDEVPMGAEANDDNMMDYDNLMAYFENLKESTA